jgi:hypothetical protein
MAGGFERSLQPLLTLFRKAYLAIFVYPPRIENPPLTHARLGFQRHSADKDGRAGAIRHAVDCRSARARTSAAVAVGNAMNSRSGIPA